MSWVRTHEFINCAFRVVEFLLIQESAYDGIAINLSNQIYLCGLCNEVISKTSDICFHVNFASLSVPLIMS